jgi:hypothetical protein
LLEAEQALEWVEAVELLVSQAEMLSAQPPAGKVSEQIRPEPVLPAWALLPVVGKEPV